MGQLRNFKRPLLGAALAGSLCVVFFFLRGLSSTNQSSTNDDTPSQSDASAPPRARVPPNMKTVQITEPFKVASVDANKGQWPTEVLTDHLQEQLDRLGRLLSDASSSSQALSPVATEDVVAIELSPTVERCFECGSIVVERCARNAAATTELQGLDELAATLAEFSRPVEDATDVHSKFKITHIESGPGTANTTVRLSMNGKAPSGFWQQNCVWNCVWDTSFQRPRLNRLESVADKFERVLYSASQRFFTDATQAVLGECPGYAYQLAHGTNYWLARLESAYGIDLLGAHGLAIADVNGDGLDDVYVCQPGGLPNRLFVRSADGGLSDQSAAFGLDLCDATRSALFIDLDNDGDQDAIIVLGVQVSVFEHTNDTFSLRKQIRVPINPTAVVAADFDSDRLLDLYVLNHDSELASGERGVLGMPVPFHDANNGGANVLLKNLGDFAFDDVTTEVGLDINNRRFSLAGCWEDYDDDGDMDLYVANDFGRNNLYRNESGTFVDVSSSLGVEDQSAGMSVSWGDVNNDRLQDLYVSNMFSSAGNRIAYQRDFHRAETANTRTAFQRHARGNTLFLQGRKETFVDVSEPWNATMGRWAWSSKLADINNDGFLDVLITNGFVTNEDTDDL